MSTLTVFIVEDEAPAREKLMHQLTLLDNIQLLGFAEDGKQAVTQINQLTPDLILLDINMPELNGMDVLTVLTHQPMVIFTTAYDQYALQAFEKRALDYLLKPYSLARLKEAINRAQGLHQKNPVTTTASEAQAGNHTGKKNQKLISHMGERMYMLSPSDICFFKAEQGTLAFGEKKSWPLKETLDQLESKLADTDFIRVHRSYLVNIEHIEEMQRWFNGKLMLIINDANKTQISTSRAGADRIKKLLS